MSIYVKIKKSFGDFALDVEFEAENDVLALFGASGCGKSMTLKCISGVVRPDEGRIIVDGAILFDSKKKINIPPQDRHVGLLFQNYALFPNMTVEQNIMSVLARGKKCRNKGERLRSLMESFYINGLEHHYPVQLSGGQQQRVALARILASDPSIIMLDEPLSALDSYLRWQLEQELVQLLESFRGTTLYVSHNRDEVYRICGKVCVMNMGHSERVCPVRDLFEAPQTLAAAILSGCKNYSRIERLNENRVRAIDWNVELKCDRVADDIRYIGVRSHFIVPCDGRDENVIRCRVLRVTQDVFSSIFILQPENTNPSCNFSHIRIETPKRQSENICAGDNIFVKIPPQDILLLKRSF
ncbi:MAG: ATP-binding cassette domain-containing protein [Synergistaceae bacterium]|nr:ATP-binding cassette domain-containing protein [Synergistaceae bacterium]